MEYPALYKDFIEQVILNPETTQLTVEQLNKLFALHNNFVDLHNPAYNKSCSKCVKDAFIKVKDHYTEK